MNRTDDRPSQVSGVWTKLALLGVIALTVVLGLLLGLKSITPKAHAATARVGYRDFSYGSATSSPTGNKPQDKLWYTPEGTWWGVLFNKGRASFDIYRFNKAHQHWADAGVVVDKRNNSKADTLWDGKHLYVVSAPVTSAGADHNAYIKRYTYHPATKRYSLNKRFPVKIGRGPMEAITLAKDSTGKLWVSFTRGNANGRKVYVNHSLSTQSRWATPYVVPVPRGARDLSADDISATVSFDRGTGKPKVGVMWSNQNNNKIYFAAHRDGAPPEQWAEFPAAVRGPKSADDHINLKSLKTDPSGRIFAVTKTSYNDGHNANQNAPLILLVVLGHDGTFHRYTVSRVRDNETRPILLIDKTHRRAYVFAAAPVGGGAIYYKSTPLANISFSPGRGRAFIENPADPKVDNATSTNQNLNAKSGLVVLASDEASHYYLHNYRKLARR